MIGRARPAVLSGVHDRLPRPDRRPAPGTVQADPAAELLAAWTPVVLRWCMRLGGRGVDAEDAAQDVLLRLLDQHDTIRDAQALPAWLYRTTRRVIIDHERRAWVRRWVPGLAPDVADPARGPSTLAEVSAATRAVRTVLAELPVDLREVLVLHEMEERDGPEVARLLGVPEGTVRSRLQRARVAFGRTARRLGLAQLVATSIEEGG